MGPVMWTLLATVGIGVGGYVCFRKFFDWLIDDMLMGKGQKRLLNYLGSDIHVNMFDPSKKLVENAKTRPNEIMLLFEDQKISFSEADEQTNRYAQALHQAGFHPDNQAALLMYNKPEYVYIFYACLRLTTPLALINTNLRHKPLLHCINEGGAKYLIVEGDDNLLKAVDEIYDELQALNIRVLVSGRHYTETKYQSLDSLVAISSKDPPNSAWIREIDSHSLAAYIFTSGTTGLPKAARITYYKIMKAAAVYCIAGVQDTDTVYMPLPLYHSAALLAGLTSCQLIGCTFAFAKKFSLSKYWEDCVKHGASVIGYIGETCRYLLTRPESPNDKKHNVRAAVGNGMRKDVWEEFQTRFNIGQIYEFFAATEGNVGLMNVRNKLGSCGRVSPLLGMIKGAPVMSFIKYDTELDEIVRNERGFCVPSELGEPGLLIAAISDTARFDGYSDKQQTERKIIRNVKEEGDMYFNTGDLLLRDKDYYVYFVDRVGDTFRWKGENVSTLEVANILGELDIVHDCTVYGVSIPHVDGKCGMVAVVLQAQHQGHGNEKSALQKIHDHVTNNLPAYARPIFLRFVPELAVTGTFKHQKSKLREEGYDLDKVKDVYMLSTKSAAYIRLDRSMYNDLADGVITC